MKVCLLSILAVVNANQLLLVSIDGFRWDYLKDFNTPNLDRLAKRGTKSKYMNNMFPTKTHTNHYSIATGLYPESHGMVGNNMYDPLFNEFYIDSVTNEGKWFNAAEPIWVALRRQGRTCGTVCWPDAHVEIRGYKPNLYIPLSETLSADYRINKAIDWLTKKRFDFVALHLIKVDLVGHDFGPYSAKLRKTVEEMDKSIGNLLDKMDSSNLWSKVNVIVVSDHGMTKTDLSKVIDISDYVDMSLIERHVENGAYMFIHPVEGKIDKVVEDLKQTSHMTVYRKNEIPDRLHFKNNRRVLPVFLLADEGWSIITNKTKLPDIIDTGAHGYDNNLLSMKPIFMAAGPNIKRNHITPVFKNTDLYPRMCKLLGIQPMPNNGSLEATSSFIV